MPINPNKDIEHLMKIQAKSLEEEGLSPEYLRKHNQYMMERGRVGILEHLRESPKDSVSTKSTNNKSIRSIKNKLKSKKITFNPKNNVQPFNKKNSPLDVKKRRPSYKINSLAATLNGGYKKKTLKNNKK